MSEPLCPTCGCEMEYDEVDTQRGPAACRNCHEFEKTVDGAGRVMTVREIFDVGFKAGLSKAGLTERSDDAFSTWIWSREK